MRMILHIRFFLFDAVVVFIVFLIYVKHLVVSDSRARLRSTPACKVFGKNTGAGTARMIFSANPDGAPALHNPSGRRTTFAGRKEIVHLFFRSACDEDVKKEKRNMPSDTFRHDDIIYRYDGYCFSCFPSSCGSRCLRFGSLAIRSISSSIICTTSALMRE